MTLEEMKQRKKEMGLSYEEIARLSNLPVGTVQKVLGGITRSPRYDTLLALEKVLEQKMPDMVREPSAYMADKHKEKKQGEYTLEDYYAIPDDRRVELIDGVIYDMASPTTIHQILITEICTIFRRHIAEKGGKCVPIVAPIDVQLDCDDKTMVQPDMIVVCDREKLKNHVYGNPDLAIEILSPSSKKMDNQIKSKKYEAAGVKEYWIVDPEKKKILVQNFAGEEWPAIYSFNDKIPVHIFAEECEIDFAEINAYIEFMYE